MPQTAFLFLGDELTQQQHAQAFSNADVLIILVSVGMPYHYREKLEAFLKKIAADGPNKELVFIIGDTLQTTNLMRKEPTLSAKKAREKAFLQGTEYITKYLLPSAQKEGISIKQENIIRWDDVEQFQREHFQFPEAISNMPTFLKQNPRYAQAVNRQAEDYLNRHPSKSTNKDASLSPSPIEIQQVTEYVHLEASHWATIYFLVMRKFPGRRMAEMYPSERGPAIQYAYDLFIEGKYINEIPLSQCYSNLPNSNLTNRNVLIPRVAFSFSEPPKIVKESVSLDIVFSFLKEQSVHITNLSDKMEQLKQQNERLVQQNQNLEYQQQRVQNFLLWFEQQSEFKLAHYTMNFGPFQKPSSSRDSSTGSNPISSNNSKNNSSNNSETTSCDGSPPSSFTEETLMEELIDDPSTTPINKNTFNDDPSNNDSLQPVYNN